MLVMNTEEKEVREGVVTYYGDLTTTANYLCRFQKDEAEDLTQQTVTQALTHTSQYKPGTNIKGWLLTIMHNLFVNLYRYHGTREECLVYIQEHSNEPNLGIIP